MFFMIFVYISLFFLFITEKKIKGIMKKCLHTQHYVLEKKKKAETSSPADLFVAKDFFSVHVG